MFLEVGRVGGGGPILIYLECTWVVRRITFLLHMYKNLCSVAASEQPKQSKAKQALKNPCFLQSEKLSSSRGTFSRGEAH